MSQNKVTGIVLAGGKSSRMGENKALLKINGVTVIEKITNVMKTVCDEIIMVTNTPEEYAFLGYPMFRDEKPYDGPLQAVSVGLKNATYNHCLVISCDLPFIQENVLRGWLNHLEHTDAVVPMMDGQYHPLSACYKKESLPIFEQVLVEEEKRSMRKALNRLDYVLVNMDNRSEEEKQALLNMNDKDDYEQVKTIATEQ